MSNAKESSIDSQGDKEFEGDLTAVIIRQETSWQVGKPVPVELLSKELHSKSNTTENHLALIWNEVYLRQLAGESPKLDDYQQRFPDIASVLEAQWRLDSLLSSLVGAPSGTTKSLDGDSSKTHTLHDGHATRLLDEGAQYLIDGIPDDLEQSQTKLPQELIHHPRYRLVRQIGRGGMGTVWLAMHVVMNRPVALKIIRPDLLSHKGSIARFRREVQAAAKLQHANVVTAYDAEQIGDTLFLVVEFVEGETLARQVSRQKLSVQEACNAIRDAALGMAHAHAMGLIHRDIKPGNLIRTRSGIVKILDFGLVFDPSDNSSITGDNIIMGTPDYVAPEQAVAPSSADMRSDIYSLGCTFYHLLNGKAPFAGMSLVSKLDAHRYSTPAPIEGVPKQLMAIIHKMSAKRPDDRFQTAQSIIQALAPFCGEGGLNEQSSERSKKQKSSLMLRRGALLGTGIGLCGFAIYRSGWFDRDMQATLAAEFPPTPPAPIPTPDLSSVASDGVTDQQRTEVNVETSIGDGLKEDFQFDGRLLRLNGMGDPSLDNEYRQIWLNFDHVRGTKLSMRGYFRPLHSKSNGLFKLIFMSPRFGEVFFSIKLANMQITIEEPKKGDVKNKNFVAKSYTRHLRDYWTPLEFSIDGDQLVATMEGTPAIKASCFAADDYFCCLAAQKCSVEVFDLRILKYA